VNRLLPVLSAAAVRDAEHRYPQLLADGTLMQRAAHAVAAECLAEFRDRGRIVGRHALLLVGSGDNGGDALFAGAVLASRGVAVFALPLSGSMHAAGAEALLQAGGRFVDVPGALALFDRIDLVLDGIVGLGSTRPLEGDASLIARAIADAELFTVAIDIPSGVHADTGAVAGVTIAADLTVTFGALRRAHVIVPAALRCGEVRIADIGVPMASDDVAITATGHWFDPPAPKADKYARGVVGVVTGSLQYPGAALLSVRSALRSGCGMVRYFGSARATVVIAHPEVVASEERAIAAARCQAWAVGCGAGTDDDAATALAEVLMHEAPVVIDADAITLLSQDRHLRELVCSRGARGALTLLTPHAGELERIAGGLGLIVDLEADRLGAVQAVARELSVVVLLKGPSTLITDGERLVATPLLGSQLATAGSGDVLAGLLAGAIARWVAAGAFTRHDLLELAGACALRHAAAALRQDNTASDLLVGLEEAQSATMAP